MAFTMTLGIFAQRTMDVLSRGLVAVKTSSGIFCSWRIFGEEYYDVKYNIYRDGVLLNTTPLNVSNYTDASGTTSSSYTVAPVARGVEQSKCSAVTPWSDGYLQINLGKVYSNNGGSDITSQYEPNDVSVADLDGDGTVELLVKRKNTVDDANLFAVDDKDFDILEAYKLDGTRLWWIDCGPNMVSGSSVETNIVAYDWDGDGKAEVILRGADGMVLHKADGTTQTIGDASVNTRNTVSHTANMTYTNSGAEYLLYLNGQTAQPYQVLDYPLTRGNASDWGDSYGHRSSKNFFGAPFLDGRKPSIFLARGIYTRHKMIAYDVDASTHSLKQRWYWECLDSSSPWYGQGYHNYGIADVDWDGRDEIVYGSMVIDDNGKGLSTTGLGHGDAQHCGDFNPYVHGQEIFACNEDNPNNNYRDATTSQIYYRTTSSADDGRAIMGKFTDDFPGEQGSTAHDGNLISSITNKGLEGGTKNNIDQNFRIYWDGDLCEETFNYEAWNSSDYSEIGSPRVCKYGRGSIQSFPGTLTCNGTKGTPCSQSDILGDWREELILRTKDNNLRIYTTTDPTEYRNYTLWHDMQYRNAMVWEMCGYNQPPHVSYFLGKTEGITVAPPPLTMTNRTEISNGSSIGSTYNDKQIIMAETNDMNVSVADGASPYIFVDNAPTWVQGHDDNNNITTTTYTHTITGGAFAGSMRLVKQGDGILTLPSVIQKYSGNTDVWAGTVNFDGEMLSSRVWLNRFATLNSNGGKFDKGIEMNYASSLCPGGNNKVGIVITDSLIMNYGSRAVLDVYATDNAADNIKVNVLKLEKKDWTNGPTYSTPVFQIIPHYATGASSLPEGKYILAEVGKIEGDIADIEVEGVGSQKATLSYEDSKIYLNVHGVRDATTITWTGSDNTTWDLAESENFKITATDEKNIFVSGDKVIFDDNATNSTVNISKAVAPGSITLDNSKLEYTVTGDSIIGTTGIDKNGTSNVNINNVNTFTGTTNINSGKITVNTLANETGVQQGSLGKLSSTINLNGGTLSNSASVTTSQPITIGINDGFIEVPANLSFITTGSIKSGTKSNLYKTGAGTLTTGTSCGFKNLYINAGTVIASENGSSIHQYPDTVIFNGGTLKDPDNIYTYSTNNVNIVVPTGKTGTWYLDERCNYTGKLTGAGIFNVYATGPRLTMSGDWSAFTGNLNINGLKTGSYDPEFTINNSYGMKNATVNVGYATNNNGKNFDFGNLTGSGTLLGSGTYTVGALNNTITWNGTLNGCKIIKVGSGTWTMSTIQSSLGGQVAVKGGTLHLNNPASSSKFFGNNQVVVSDSGTLAGIALLYNVDVQDGGTIAPGVINTHKGTLSLAGNLYAYANSHINLYIQNANNTSTSGSFLKVGGTLSINGDINITKSGFTPEAGDSISLWTAGTFTGIPTAVNLPDISSYGLEWDTSKLLQANGTLLVKVSTGIVDINADADVECFVYTTSGIRVGEFEGKKSNVVKDIRDLGLGFGTYIIKMRNAEKTETIKIAIH